jgi:hypothetical protein
VIAHTAPTAKVLLLTAVETKLTAAIVAALTLYLGQHETDRIGRAPGSGLPATQDG